MHYSVSPLWLADPADRVVRHRRDIRPALPPTAPNTAFHATVDTPDISCELLEGVVEVDQTEIPFREGDAFLDRGNAGKILVIGAVEVIDRDTDRSKPRRKHAKYLDTRSGRIRLAMIADNSAASIEAFVKANVKRGTTLLPMDTRPIRD